MATALCGRVAAAAKAPCDVQGVAGAVVEYDGCSYLTVESRQAETLGPIEDAILASQGPAR